MSYDKFNLESFTSTKFVITAVSLLMVYIAFMVGKLDADTFMPFILGILTQYSVTNTISKFSKTDSAN